MSKAPTPEICFQFQKVAATPAQNNLRRTLSSRMNFTTKKYLILSLNASYTYAFK